MPLCYYVTALASCTLLQVDCVHVAMQNVYGYYE